MAISKVIANIEKEEKKLENTIEDRYEGDITAPSKNGNYYVEINAYDSSGNVSVARENLEVTLWKEPKVNWKPTDRFNFSDYNRIKNNLKWLHDKSVKLYQSFSIEDMGEDINDELSYWNPKLFNAWERNIEIINKNIFEQNYGISQTFFENGPFIRWDELNRIESATLKMRMILDSIESGLKKIPFRLGTFKEVRI